MSRPKRIESSTTSSIWRAKKDDKSRDSDFFGFALGSLSLSEQDQGFNLEGRGNLEETASLPLVEATTQHLSFTEGELLDPMMDFGISGLTLSAWKGIRIFLSFFQRTFAIMVPTGKLGPITPRKITEEEVMEPRSYKEPAEVWERIDEGPNPYHPYVYKYTLLDFVRKYGRQSLVLPPPEEFYMPKLRAIYHGKDPLYYKTKFYYSPSQFL